MNDNRYMEVDSRRVPYYGSDSSTKRSNSKTPSSIEGQNAFKKVLEEKASKDEDQSEGQAKVSTDDREQGGPIAALSEEKALKNKKLASPFELSQERAQGRKVLDQQAQANLDKSAFVDPSDPEAQATLRQSASTDRGQQSAFANMKAGAKPNKEETYVALSAEAEGNEEPKALDGRGQFSQTKGKEGTFTHIEAEASANEESKALDNTRGQALQAKGQELAFADIKADKKPISTLFGAEEGVSYGTNTQESSAKAVSQPTAQLLLDKQLSAAATANVTAQGEKTLKEGEANPAQVFAAANATPTNTEKKPQVTQEALIANANSKQATGQERPLLGEVKEERPYDPFSFGSKEPLGSKKLGLQSEGHFTREAIDVAAVNQMALAPSSAEGAVNASQGQMPQGMVRSNVQELIQQMVKQMTELSQNGKTETSIVLQHPPLFAGARLTITAFDTAHGEFNIAFENLKMAAQQVLDTHVHRSQLLESLERHGYNVHIFTTSTTIETRTMFADAELRDRDQDQGDNQQPS